LVGNDHTGDDHVATSVMAGILAMTMLAMSTSAMAGIFAGAPVSDGPSLSEGPLAQQVAHPRHMGSWAPAPTWDAGPRCVGEVQIQIGV
jgi:hypothetical protein